VYVNYIIYQLISSFKITLKKTLFVTMTLHFLQNIVFDLELSFTFFGKLYYRLSISNHRVISFGDDHQTQFLTNCFLYSKKIPGDCNLPWQVPNINVNQRFSTKLGRQDVFTFRPRLRSKIEFFFVFGVNNGRKLHVFGS
jgi:hypothetical protein